MAASRSRYYGLIVVAGVLWGSTFSLARIATADGIHPIAIAAYQALISGVLLLGICAARGYPLFVREQFRHCLVISLCGVTLPSILFYYAAPALPAGVLAITVSTVPLLTYGLAWVFKTEPFAVTRAFGIVMGMIAVLLLVLPEQGFARADANFWLGLVILASLLYAIENLYVAEMIPAQTNLIGLLCGAMLIGAGLLFPVVWAMGVWIDPGWFINGDGWSLIMIVLTSTAAYLMFLYTIRHAGPVFASQCGYLVTIFGVVWGIWLFREDHSWWIWSSLAVMMAGLALVTPYRRPGAISG